MWESASIQNTSLTGANHHSIPTFHQASQTALKILWQGKRHNKYYNHEQLNGCGWAALVDRGALTRVFSIKGTTKVAPRIHFKCRSWVWCPELLLVMYYKAKKIGTEDWVNTSRNAEIRSTKLKVWNVLPFIAEGHRCWWYISSLLWVGALIPLPWPCHTEMKLDMAKWTILHEVEGFVTPQMALICSEWYWCVKWRHCASYSVKNDVDDSESNNRLTNGSGTIRCYYSDMTILTKLNNEGPLIVMCGVWHCQVYFPMRMGAPSSATEEWPLYWDKTKRGGAMAFSTPMNERALCQNLKGLR